MCRGLRIVWIVGLCMLAVWGVSAQTLTQALVPAALGLEDDPGSEIQAPLALVIVCGVFSSTMFVAPTIYWTRVRQAALSLSGDS